MINKSAVMAIMVAVGLFAAALASAQTAAYNDGENGVSRHHLMLSEMMKGMIQQMSQMSDEMSRGAFTPEESKQMARRMEQMSKVMHRMSGLEARPAMKEEDAQKQMQQMRKQMDEMTTNPAIVPGAK